jgi:hypothetical protein
VVTHLDRLRRIGAPTEPDDYLVPNLRGERISRQRVCKIVRQAAEVASERVEDRLFDQIAAVTPPAEDAATVSAWINHRRQANAYNLATASAIKNFKIRKANRLISRADAEAEASERAISGFGLQVCGRVTRSR